MPETVKIRLRARGFSIALIKEVINSNSHEQLANASVQELCAFCWRQLEKDLELI